MNVLRCLTIRSADASATWAERVRSAAQEHASANKDAASASEAAGCPSPSTRRGHVSTTSGPQHRPTLSAASYASGGSDAPIRPAPAQLSAGTDWRARQVPPGVSDEPSTPLVPGPARSNPGRGMTVTTTRHGAPWSAMRSPRLEPAQDAASYASGGAGTQMVLAPAQSSVGTNSLAQHASSPRRTLHPAPLRCPTRR